MANTGQQKFKYTQISQTLKLNNFKKIFFFKCTQFKVSQSLFFTLTPSLCFILYVKTVFKIGKITMM